VSESAIARRTTSALDWASTRPLGGSASATRVATTLEQPANHPVSIAEKEADARRSIAQWLVLAYIGLVAFGVMTSVIMLWIPRSAQTFTVADVKEVMGSITGVLTGLVGVLGFVMGYYFKSVDSAAARLEPPRAVMSLRRKAK
jgi:uncharacterized membrane-anchored protein